MAEGSQSWFRPRISLVVTSIVVGFVIGGFLTVVLSSFVVDFRRAGEITFSLGALAMGFGSLGWAGSIMAGTGFENLQKYLDAGMAWNERDSRRAMTRIAAFGLGCAIATSLLLAIH